MTDEEVEKVYDEMVKMFGNELPHPEHEPIRFTSYVKMYRYLKERSKENG